MLMQKKNNSEERKKYLKKIRLTKILTLFTQLPIYPNFFVFKIIFSSRTTASYIIAATAASITTLAITKSSWNTWPPYTIK